MWENKWKHNIIITNDQPKYNGVDWVFGFQYLYILWEQSRPMVVRWFDYLILAEMFHICEKKEDIPLEKMLEFAKSFAVRSLFLFFIISILEIGPFSFSMR